MTCTASAPNGFSASDSRKTVLNSGIAADVLRLVAMVEEMIIEGWPTYGRSLPLQAIAVVGVGEDGIGVRTDLPSLGVARPWFDDRAETQEGVL
jgi:hypothetical protein